MDFLCLSGGEFMCVHIFVTAEMFLGELTFVRAQVYLCIYVYKCLCPKTNLCPGCCFFLIFPFLNLFIKWS